VEAAREATTTSSATTTTHTTSSEAATAHLSTKHLEKDFGVDLRAHAAHTTAEATTAKLF